MENFNNINISLIQLIIKFTNAQNKIKLLATQINSLQRRIEILKVSESRETQSDLKRDKLKQEIENLNNELKISMNKLLIANGKYNKYKKNLQELSDALNGVKKLR